MIQWVKLIATKLDKLSSTPETHIVKREPTPAICLLISICIPWHANTYTQKAFRNHTLKHQ